MLPWEAKVCLGSLYLLVVWVAVLISFRAGGGAAMEDVLICVGGRYRCGSSVK